MQKDHLRYYSLILLMNRMRQNLAIKEIRLNTGIVILASLK